MNRLHGLEQLIGALLDGLRASGHRSPPVSLLQAFYAVCEEEGLSVEEYAKRVGLPQSTMSGHLLDLGEHNRKGEPRDWFLMPVAMCTCLLSVGTYCAITLKRQWR
jgi:hypothetical protein